MKSTMTENGKEIAKRIQPQHVEVGMVIFQVTPFGARKHLGEVVAVDKNRYTTTLIFQSGEKKQFNRASKLWRII